MCSNAPLMHSRWKPVSVLLQFDPTPSVSMAPRLETIHFCREIKAQIKGKECSL